MSAREVGEAFLRAVTMGEISFEHSLDRARCILGFDLTIDFTAALCLRAEAAADMDVIGLGSILFVRGLGFGAKKPDIANVMLRAGIRTTGEMNIQRLVEGDAALAPLRDGFGMPLGVGHRQTATGIAGAGDEPGADRGRLGRER